MQPSNMKYGRFNSHDGSSILGNRKPYGLLACEMYNTTRAMIENLGSLVERFGFVPNGGRVYYLRRSQPPLLAGMVYEYYEVTKDRDFVMKMLPILEKELTFWNNNRMTTVTVKGTDYFVYRYNTKSNMPRPESYAQDIKKAQTVPDKAQFWQDIASAAESGWDFSTRWFSDHKTIYTVETKNVLPVDLNAFICWNFDILEFDFNLRTGSHNMAFYPSITVPLFTGCYNTLNQGKSERLFTLMKDIGVFDYPGGIPTSMITDSEEQWDFPNGFSPLNHMVVEGLRKSQNAQMQDAGYRLARKWIMGNFKVWKETNHMWEKSMVNSY
ncbi:alpha,alpha-trehalase [Ancylostoma duodenale]|uniref:Trehalase n=1 Tax=Ancylostoma duodenale TaxID=51022 RepID=A0A0C2D2V7_9BILA|nr:alpha,alpha-trehalase [Ancylostoma duodenale]